MQKSVLLVALAALLSGGCLVSAEVSSLGYVEIAAHSNAQRQEAGIGVARNAGELEALWLAAGLASEIPEIDFDREMVVAYFMGGRATGGFSTRVVDLEGGAAHAKLHVRNTSPARGCPVTQATTSPVVLIRTSRVATVTLGEVDSALSTCD